MREAVADEAKLALLCVLEDAARLLMGYWVAEEEVNYGFRTSSFEVNWIVSQSFLLQDRRTCFHLGIGPARDLNNHAGLI